ncbi:MAG: S9 family peptidase, partial [Coleofasciculaceae cyanobacterium SM2_1_6]|nr:S9 family peptidase [Coleofasciculaceae cyanobacterium SM2_1_6]
MAKTDKIDREIASYGSWRSPITADLIVGGSIGLGQVEVDGETIYWTEGRPSEGGRNALVCQTSQGEIIDLLPVHFNVRSRVHEYGGGAFTVAQGVVYFVNFADQRIYQLSVNLSSGTQPQPVPITAAGNYRYADLLVDRHRQSLIAIREDHSAEGEPINTLVAIDLKNPQADNHPDSNLENLGQQILAAGQDFYSSPALSPDGKSLAWLAWQHPDLPWYNTQLWVAAIDLEGNLSQAQVIAGGLDESVFQPEWGLDGSLYFVNDRSNWWNLYRWHQGEVTAICPMDAEFACPSGSLAWK